MSKADAHHSTPLTHTCTLFALAPDAAHLLETGSPAARQMAAWLAGATDEQLDWLTGVVEQHPRPRRCSMSATRNARLSRRSILAAAALPIAVTPATTPPHPDAALLAAYAEFEAAWEAQRRLPDDSTEEAFNAEHDTTARIARRIIGIRAVTEDGMKAKARVLRWCGHEDHEIGPGLFGDTIDLGIAGSILRDLIMGGAA